MMMIRVFMCFLLIIKKIVGVSAVTPGAIIRLESIRSAFSGSIDGCCFISSFVTGSLEIALSLAMGQRIAQCEKLTADTIFSTESYSVVAILSTYNE